MLIATLPSARTGVERLLRVKDAAVRWIEETGCAMARNARATEERMKRINASAEFCCASSASPTRSLMNAGQAQSTRSGNPAAFLICGITTRRLSNEIVNMRVETEMTANASRSAPEVEYSKLCGKCRNVTPCGLS